MSGFAICVIGNSHVAALKLALTDSPPKLRDGVSLTFFSAQNRLMNRLERNGSKLVAGTALLAEKLSYTSGGEESIALKRYDAFILVGSGFGIDVPKLSEEYGTIAPGQSERMLSQAVLSAAVEAHMEACMALSLSRMIRAVTEAPIVLVGAPFVSERELLEPPFSERPWLDDPAFLEPFVAACRAAGERVARHAGLEVVWQAEGTYRGPGYTTEEFNRNPVRFKMMSNAQAPEFDAKHGNAQYGALMLGNILARLDTMCGGRVLAA